MNTSNRLWITTAALLLTAAGIANADSVGWWRFEGDGSNSANPGFLTAGIGTGTTRLTSDVAHATILDPITGTIHANTGALKISTGNGGSVADDPALDAPSFTIETFVRLQNTGGSWPAFLGHRVNGFGWQLDTDPSAQPRFRIDTDTVSPGQNQTLTDTGTIYSDDWHHAAIAFDKTTGRAQLYIDYRLVGSKAIVGNLDNVHNVATSLAFMTNSAFGDNAALDEVRYSNTALRRDQFLRDGQKVTAFFDDFDGGQQTAAGVSAALTGAANSIESVAGFTNVGSNTFAGNFLRNTADNVDDGAATKTVLTLTNLPAHSHVDIRFLLAILDSWDGSSAPNGPDIFNVVVDGVSLASRTFAGPASVASGNWAGNAAYGDSAFDSMMLFSNLTGIAHTSDTLTIELFASGAGWSGGSDESWAVENFEVILTTAIPEPTMLAALALLGGALIRRR